MDITNLFWQLVEVTGNEYLDLHPAASQSEIKDAQEVMGVSFPESLIQLYQCANGEVISTESGAGPSFGLFGEISFASLERVISRHQRSTTHMQQFGHLVKYPKGRSPYRSLPKNVIKAAPFNAQWIPFAIGDNNATDLAVDMDPGLEGAQAQIIMFGSDPGTYVFHVSDSLQQLMRALIHRYINKTGHRFFGDEQDNLDTHVYKQYKLY